MKVNTGETIGLKRKVDLLGRITIPSEFRENLNLEQGNLVEIFLIKNGIFIKVKE